MFQYPLSALTSKGLKYICSFKMSRRPTQCCVVSNKLTADYGLTKLFLCTSWKT